MNKMKDWKEQNTISSGKRSSYQSCNTRNPIVFYELLYAPNYSLSGNREENHLLFWGSKIKDKKCHWASWETLTASKLGGGIRFCELHFFNLAMLAKKLWVLLQHQSQLPTVFLR